jgi:hypothetical protein
MSLFTTSNQSVESSRVILFLGQASWKAWLSQLQVLYNSKREPSVDDDKKEEQVPFYKDKYKKYKKYKYKHKPGSSGSFDLLAAASDLLSPSICLS